MAWTWSAVADGVWHIVKKHIRKEARSKVAGELLALLAQYGDMYGTELEEASSAGRAAK